MQIHLSDHFTYSRLIRFVIPPIITMIFTSVYSIVDGLFVSNFAGKTSFAALNLIFPMFMMLGALGFMMGTGGSAMIGKTLGEGERELANRYFTLILITTFAGGILFALAGQLCVRGVAYLLGARDAMLAECVVYGRIMLIGMPFFMLQNVFQALFITAEKPRMGLGITVAAGCLNMVLDYVLVGVLRLGLAGAAWATVISQISGALLPVLYFAFPNQSLLRLTKTRWYGRVLGKILVNGSSELMSSIAASVVTMLYNFQLLRLAGENGVAAYGVIAYVSFIFSAIFLGYVSGTSPIISFNYGAQNHEELKNLFRKSLWVLITAGIVMMALSIGLSDMLAQLFVGYDPELRAMTVHGIKLYSISFLLCGFNIFGSALFTALNDGVISAAISFLRTCVFNVGALLILPLFLDLNGIWLAVTAAEILSLTVTEGFILANRRKYRYL